MGPEQEGGDPQVVVGLPEFSLMNQRAAIDELAAAVRASVQISLRRVAQGEPMTGQQARNCALALAILADKRHDLVEREIESAVIEGGVHVSDETVREGTDTVARLYRRSGSGSGESAAAADAVAQLEASGRSPNDRDLGPRLPPPSS